ncbi:hypothetical protein ABK040_000886 [Willaertia magna]
MSSFYDFTAVDAQENTISMEDYRGKVVLIVNVASKCGFADQYGMFIVYSSTFPLISLKYIHYTTFCCLNLKPNILSVNINHFNLKYNFKIYLKEPLQKLYEEYKDKGLEILAFPCNQFGKQEPGNSSEICKFVKQKFNVEFKIFEKIEVNGDNALPLYKYLKKEGKGFITDAIKWNFTKFLIDKQGNVYGRYSPMKNPKSMAKDINKLLQL